MNERNDGKYEPPKNFEMNNPTTKEIDSNAYWRATRKSIPCKTPCCVCNEVVTIGEMSKIVYDHRAALFDPLFPSRDRSQRSNNSVHAKKVLTCTDSERLRVCKKCEKKLRAKKVPTTALKNGLDFGEVPQELQNLSMTEQRMISICNSITTFVKIGHGATSQMATIGGIAYLTNDITEYSRILPRPPSSSRIVYIRILKNVTAGESGPRTYTKFEIRPDKIRNALYWLKANNPLYADVTLDFRYLEDWASTEAVVHDIIEDASLPEVLQSHKSDNETNGEKKDECSCASRQVHEVLIEDTDCGDAVKELAERLSIKHKSSTPVEFEGLTNSQFVKPYEVERFWEKSFPALFPFGRAGPQHDPLERENVINDTEYDKHVLKESSRRFSQNMMWMASRYRYRTSRDASSVAYAASLHEKTPTAGDIRQVSTHSSNGIARDYFNKEMEALLRKLVCYGGKLKTSFLHIKQERRKLLARISSAEMNEPIFFLTLSSGDLYWPELYQAIFPEKKKEEIKLLTYEERAKALHDNPVLAARMFKSRVDNILKYILQGSSHPLGFLTDWWFRVEFQNRGSLHVHTILWALLHFRLGDKEWWNGDELTGLLAGDTLTLPEEDFQREITIIEEEQRKMLLARISSAEMNEPIFFSL